MARTDIISPEGLRIDGRRPLEVRRHTFTPSILNSADGSAMVEQGKTKVLACVYGPREALQKSSVLQDRAVIHVQYSFASFSSGQRKERIRKDRRLEEVAAMIKETFEPIIHTHSAPRSEIRIDIQVLQSDGSAFAAAINATTLALVDAGIPITCYVAANSAIWTNDQSVIDPTYLEESADVSQVTVATTDKGDVCMISFEPRLNLEHLPDLIDIAAEGATTMIESIDSSIRTMLSTSIPIE